MWILMALMTAVSWGLCYLCGEQIIKKIDKSIYLSILGSSNLIFWFIWFNLNRVTSKTSYESFGSIKWWLVFAIISSLTGNYLSLNAIELKNATYASVVEVSYPIFCALFAIMLLGQNTLTINSVLGMSMVLGGTIIFILGEK